MFEDLIYVSENRDFLSGLVKPEGFEGMQAMAVAMTREQFIATVAPVAMCTRLEGSAIFPSVRIAQAIQETGGKSINDWNNLVGFKVGSGKPNVYWHGESVNKTTWEVYSGVTETIKANFRKYDSIYDCFKDQDLLFEWDNYDPVRNATDAYDQCESFRRCTYPYATDPAYSNGLKAIIKMYGLTGYDDQVTVELERQAAAQAAEEERKRKEEEERNNPLRHPCGVIVNGKRIDTDGFLKDGSSYLPIRATGTAANEKVGWDEHCGEAIINGSLLESTMVVQGKGYALGREIAEALDYKITWNGSENTVSLDKE
jgi:flagellum-specific peptidoglycan hydrolase FlgJ